MPYVPRPRLEPELASRLREAIRIALTMGRRRSPAEREAMQLTETGLGEIGATPVRRSRKRIDAPALKRALEAANVEPTTLLGYAEHDSAVTSPELLDDAREEDFEEPGIIVEDLGSVPEGSEQHGGWREGFSLAQLASAISDDRRVTRRTIRRHLSEQEPLSRDAAVDLIVGIDKLGGTLPNSLLREICAARDDVAIMLPLPGESDVQLTIISRAMAEVGISDRKIDLIERRLRAAFAPNDRLMETELGRKIIEDVRGQYGSDWRVKLHERLTALVSESETGYVVRSPIARIRIERAERAAKKGRRA